MLVNGKRKWPDEFRHRYEELVNSVVNTNDHGNKQNFPNGALVMKKKWWAVLDLNR